MLNPLAHDYTPISAILSPEEKRQTRRNKPARSTDQQNKKTSSHNTHAQKSSKKQVQSKPNQTAIENKPDNKLENHTKTNKRRDSQASSTLKKQHEKGTSKRRPKPSQHASSFESFAQESKFITIEAAIDPVHRVDPQSSHIPSTSRRQSAGNLNQFEHGYERYIDWIDRSLHMFGTVTVVGMDNAIVDIVSIVTILQDREIGIHDAVETFSMDTGSGRLTSCIQVKLHPFLYNPSVQGTIV